MGAAVRLYCTGRVCVEGPGALVAERDLPGAQGRVLLVHLAGERMDAVTRDDLAADLWRHAPPRAWDTALNALVSKVRRALAPVDGVQVDATASGYALRCAAGTWIDLEQAPAALHEAEALLRRGDHAGAWGHANVAYTIAHRPLLAGHDSDWTRALRDRLRGLQLRSLDCLAQVWLTTGELELAVEAACEAVRLEPFRESGYRRLMAVHAAAGNRAEALRTYERCRRLLATELGVDPSPETTAAFRELLGS